jgi:hypothetical protein
MLRTCSRFFEDFSLLVKERVTLLKEVCPTRQHKQKRNFFIYNNPIASLPGPEGSWNLRPPDVKTINT